MNIQLSPDPIRQAPLHASIRQNGFEYALQAIDAHTGGEFCRVIIGGFPEPSGNTMIEKKQHMEQRYDNLRTALMLEPRGHQNMFGAFLCAPVHTEADFGIIFMDTGGYLNMCGHCTIGAVTVILEAGLKAKNEGINEVVLDAPSGLIRTKAMVQDGRVISVSLTNVPSFLYRDNLCFRFGNRDIPYSISFGGSFFAMVDAQKAGVPQINAETVPELTEIGSRMAEEINRSITIQHPSLDIHTLDLVEFYGPTPHPDRADLRNVVIFGDHMADRSPCGTGTSAKLAQLYAHGQIGIGQELRYESFTGSIFRGRISSVTKLGNYEAVIPVVTGSAYLTGMATYLVDAHDPFRYGFRV